MRGAERLGNGLVFLGQDAAGGIHQSPTRLEQARCAVQDGGLFGHQFLHAFGRLAPFEVGVAAQRAQARARRIHQHAIHLARQALDALVALVGNGRRVHVRQAAARQPWFERIEPVGRHIKRIQAAGAAHGGANGQRLAARARAKIHHHLATLGVQQQGQQLRAFVLHLDGAAGERIELGQRGLAFNAQAPRRIRGCY